MIVNFLNDLNLDGSNSYSVLTGISYRAMCPYTI